MNLYHTISISGIWDHDVTNCFRPDCLPENSCQEDIKSWAAVAAVHVSKALNVKDPIVLLCQELNLTCHNVGIW